MTVGPPSFLISRMALTASSCGAPRSISTTSGLEAATCSATLGPRLSPATGLPRAAAFPFEENIRSWMAASTFIVSLRSPWTRNEPPSARLGSGSCANPRPRKRTVRQTEHARHPAVLQLHLGAGYDLLLVHGAQQDGDGADLRRGSDAALAAAAQLRSRRRSCAGPLQPRPLPRTAA